MQLCEMEQCCGWIVSRDLGGREVGQARLEGAKGCEYSRDNVVERSGSRLTCGYEIRWGGELRTT